MSRLTVRGKGRLIVAVSVVFKTAMLVGLIAMQYQIERAEKSADHSKEVLATARELLWELVNAETGMRGYIISGRPVFLEPYNAAVTSVPAVRKRLEELCRDDPQQLKIAQHLQESIDDFLQYHASNKLLIEQNHLGIVAEHTRRAEGKSRMDALRREVQQLLDVQEKIDAGAHAASLRSRSQMLWLLYAGLLLNLLVAAAINTFLTRSITHRVAQMAENHRNAAAGKPFGAALQGNDEISELDAQFRKLWEEKNVETSRSLSIYSRELERSNRDLQDFASVASHDLQEPLRKIIAFGSRLEDHLGERLDEKGRDYLNRMRNAAERMSSLNESLLQLSRVRSKVAALSAVELEAVLHGVLSDLEERLKSSGGTVRHGSLPVVWADPHQMRQLFQNLISNALKFASKDRPPIVQISSRFLKTNLWEIAIQDNGVGFEQRFAEQIFRPFQRLHGRGEFEGNGIGLTIVEKIVARHGGTITVESQPDQGSKFVITLPEKREQEQLNEFTLPSSHAALIG
jgi:signal transduction histidine kinase